MVQNSGNGPKPAGWDPEKSHGELLVFTNYIFKSLPVEAETIIYPILKKKPIFSVAKIRYHKNVSSS